MSIVCGVFRSVPTTKRGFPSQILIQHSIMESQAPCKFFDLLTSAHSEASKETQIQRVRKSVTFPPDFGSIRRFQQHCMLKLKERAAAAERAFRQAAAAAEADAALARELDAAFMAEERATEEVCSRFFVKQCRQRD